MILAVLKTIIVNHTLNEKGRYLTRPSVSGNSKMPFVVIVREAVVAMTAICPKHSENFHMSIKVKPGGKQIEKSDSFLDKTDFLLYYDIKTKKEAFYEFYRSRKSGISNKKM